MTVGAPCYFFHLKLFVTLESNVLSVPVSWALKIEGQPVLLKLTLQWLHDIYEGEKDGQSFVTLYKSAT